MIAVAQSFVKAVQNFKTFLNRMVFCVIYVFGTLLEFTLLIFLQKQVFAPRFDRPGVAGSANLAGTNLWRRSTTRLSTKSVL